MIGVKVSLILFNFNIEYQEIKAQLSTQSNKLDNFGNKLDELNGNVKIMKDCLVSLLEEFKKFNNNSLKNITQEEPKKEEVKVEEPNGKKKEPKEEDDNVEDSKKDADVDSKIKEQKKEEKNNN